MITASVHKMLEDTANTNANNTNDATEKIALLSDFDLICFNADGSTKSLSSPSKGCRSKWSTSLVTHGNHQYLVDTNNFCAVAFLKLKQIKENGQHKVRCGFYDMISRHASDKFALPIGCLKHRIQVES
jgi:hypothetical protein